MFDFDFDPSKSLSMEGELIFEHGEDAKEISIAGVLDGRGRWALFDWMFELGERRMKEYWECKGLPISVISPKHHIIPCHTISYTSFVSWLDTYNYSQEWIR